MNDVFRVAIYKEFGAGYRAARATGIVAGCMSQLIQGHRGPTKGEREKLRKFFSEYQMLKFFGKPKVVKGRGPSRLEYEKLRKLENPFFGKPNVEGTKDPEVING